MDLSSYGLGSIPGLGGSGSSGSPPRTTSASASNTFGSAPLSNPGMLLGLAAVVVVLIFGVMLLRSNN